MVRAILDADFVLRSFCVVQVVARRRAFLRVPASSVWPSIMTRGNQRETDRARAQARAAKQAGPKQSGGAQQAKKESDADAMRKKQEAADVKKAAEAAALAAQKAGGQVVKMKV